MKMFFQDWESRMRTMVMAILAYASLIAILRLSGKRTLAKLNAFDLIVTVTLGSTLAPVVLSRDITLADGIVGMALLVLLQFTVTWFSVRSKVFRRMVRSEPTLLLHRGESRLTCCSRFRAQMNGKQSANALPSSFHMT
jgi:uncharacterized membrane protein YcaP (DUF421 family)